VTTGGGEPGPPEAAESGGRPLFVAPEQLLDGADAEPGDASVPKETRTAGQAAVWRRPVWLGGAAAVAVLASAGAVLMWPGDDGGSAEAGARFRSLPEACASVPASTVERLVPNARDAKPSEGGCEWKEPTAGNGGERLTARSITVGFELQDGTVRARQVYKTLWDTARNGSGRSAGEPAEIVYRPPFPLAGLGDEAFARAVQSKGSLGRNGKVVVTVRLRNAIITTEYRGSTYPLDKAGFPEHDKAEPMDTPTARAGAEEVARSAAAALAACSGCTG
jgi:hypothetical protein